MDLIRFLLDRDLRLATVTPVSVFEWIDWQDVRRELRRVWRRQGAAEHGGVDDQSAGRGGTGVVRVPGDDRDARRQSGALPAARAGPATAGAGTARASRTEAAPRRLVRQPRLLPESLDADAVEQFVASLRTHRDRAMVWATMFGGLRSAEVRSLRLAEVDFGRRRVRVLGKGRSAGIDLMALRELMGHVSLETIAGYVHQSAGQLAAEYSATRASLAGARR